jgi:hypothetical protein
MMSVDGAPAPVVGEEAAAVILAAVAASGPAELANSVTAAISTVAGRVWPAVLQGQTSDQLLQIAAHWLRHQVDVHQTFWTSSPDHLPAATPRVSSGELPLELRQALQQALSSSWPRCNEAAMGLQADINYDVPSGAKVRYKGIQYPE